MKKPNIFNLVVPISERSPTVTRIVKQAMKVDRCAARTKKGDQCENGLFSGEGGGEIEIDGMRVPLCTMHFRKAIAEGWTS